MTTTSTTSRSVLTSLRATIPRRRVDFDEALQVAELQASKLTELIRDERGLLEHHIAGLPRIRVVRETLPVSGMSHWNGREWVITIAAGESIVRQRFTLLHEFKHIIDHGSAAQLYTGNGKFTAEEQAEAAADYFAGCALVTKRALKAAWGNGLQKVGDLAAHFAVSEPAIRVRLAQTGLDALVDRGPAPRCARPIATPKHQSQRFRAVRPAFARRSYA